MMVKTALLIGLMGMLAACSNDQRGASANTASTERERPADSSAPSALTPAASTNTPPPGEAGHDAATGAARVTSGNDISGQDTIGPATAQECTQRGGTWRRAGIMKLEVCDMPTRDAGKACRGKSDCESVCVAPDRADPSGPVTGLCYRSTITVGTCLTLVEGGRIAQAQCAD